MTAGMQKPLIAALAATLFVNHAGAQTDGDLRRCREDRRVDRHVRSILARIRRRLGHRDQDGGRGFRRQGAGQADRGRRRGSSEQAGHRLGDGAQVVRRRKGRHDRQPDQFLDRARRSPARQGEEPDRHHQWLRLVPPDQRRLHAQQHSLRLRHLCAGQGNGLRDDEGRREELVLPHRRLCLRSCARGRYHRRRQVAWR